MHTRWPSVVNAPRMQRLFPRHTFLLVRAYSQTPQTVLSGRPGEPVAPLDIEVGYSISMSH